MDGISFSRNVRGVDEIQARRLFTDHDERLATIESGTGIDSIKIVNLGTDWSAGDNQIMFAAGVEGKRQFIKHGTSASPVTISGPTAKVVRTEAITAATIEAVGGAGTDGADQVAAIMGLSVGQATNQIQSVGVYGGATNSSNEETGNPDASGGYFIGRIVGGTAPKATAIGLTAIGRREVSTADMSGAEISANNQTGVAGTYSTSGASTTRVLWLYPSGTAGGGCVVNIGNPANVKAQVGIGIPKQNGGAISESSLRDDGESEFAIDIRGAKSKAAIRTISPAVGPVVIGHAELGTANALLEVMNDEAGRDPIAVFGSISATQKYTIMVRNSAGSIRPFVAGTTNDFFTGTVAGDSGIEFTAGKGFFLGAVAKTPVLRVTEGGFSVFNVAPAARQAAISEPAETLAGLKAAVNGLRAAMKIFGFTE